MRSAARWAGLIAGFGMVVVSAGGAQAQAPRPEALESRAVALIANRPDYAGAAKTFHRAAVLRSSEDAQAIADLRLAGLLYANAGNLHAAAAAMEGAGDKALTQGDFGAAAEAYANAALIGARADNGRTKLLAHRARWLADQPTVSDAARTLVHQRLRAVPTAP